MALDRKAAQDALLVTYAMDMTQGGALAPPLDPRIVGWTLRGHILGIDQVLGISTPACYGFLAESIGEPGRFVAVIRGTADVSEWIEDAAFALINHPGLGQVERGFFTLYERMTFAPLSEASKPLPIGIAGAIGSGSVHVVGHSLGAALATYLNFDLAQAFGDRVSGCFLASPRPGDADFAARFHATVQDYQVWNYAPDAVPRVPAGFGFCQLPNATVIPESPIIKNSLWCHHHSACYAALLDYSVATWATLGPQDADNVACILSR